MTFRNETAKLLNEIQYKAEGRKRQVSTSQQVTKFQLPEATQATAGHEYILTIPETQAVVHPTQIATTQPATVIAEVQQPSRPSSVSAEQTSYVVVDDQQLGTSRQMIFNPPSVAASRQEESKHNTSGLSSLFGAIPSVLQYQQIDTPQPFSPSTSTSTVTSDIFQSSKTVKTSQPVQPAESAQISGLARTSPKPKLALLRATRIFQKQLFTRCCPKTKKADRPTLTLPHSTQKLCK